MIAKLLLGTLIASIALTVRPLLSYLRAVETGSFYTAAVRLTKPHLVV